MNNQSMKPTSQRVRCHQFSVRLSDKEKALWDAKQEASGLGKTEYFIRLLKSSVIKVYLFHETVQVLLWELRKIGVNLNQIARDINSGYEYTAKSELHQMQTQYGAVMESLLKFLDHPLLNVYTVTTEEIPEQLLPANKTKEIE